MIEKRVKKKCIPLTMAFSFIALLIILNIFMIYLFKKMPDGKRLKTPLNCDCKHLNASLPLCDSVSSADKGNCRVMDYPCCVKQIWDYHSDLIYCVETKTGEAVCEINHSNSVYTKWSAPKALLLLINILLTTSVLIMILYITTNTIPMILNGTF